MSSRGLAAPVGASGRWGGARTQGPGSWGRGAQTAFVGLAEVGGGQQEAETDPPGLSRGPERQPGRAPGSCPTPPLIWASRGRPWGGSRTLLKQGAQRGLYSSNLCRKEERTGPPQGDAPDVRPHPPQRAEPPSPAPRRTDRGVPARSPAHLPSILAPALSRHAALCPQSLLHKARVQQGRGEALAQGRSG